MEAAPRWLLVEGIHGEQMHVGVQGRELGDPAEIAAKEMSTR
jgi:hypothetical protein